MRRIDALGLAQRVVLVVALGGALAVVGRFVTDIGGGAADFGWFGYAPLTEARFDSGPPTWVRLIIWLVLIGLWAAASLRLMASRPEARR